MKLIKLNNRQTKKIAGMYGKYHAMDPVFIEENFFYVPITNQLMLKYGIAKRYLKRLLALEKIKIIDTKNTSDPDVIILKKVFKETLDEADIRIKSRVTKWDYTKKEIKEEL